MSVRQFGLFFLILFPCMTFALTDLECYRAERCRSRGSSYANPSTGDRVRINPAAVPTAKGMGIEGIYFDDEVDLSIVRGNGKVGAAISPSNSEETFFGPPGFEFPNEYLERKINKRKYKSQKITLATAFDVLSKSESALSSYSVKLGVMGRYNRLTHNTYAGGGLSGTLGPLIFGGSLYSDETQLDASIYGSPLKPTLTYQVRTYNIGAFLSSLAVDYSKLEVNSPDIATVTLLTASLSVSKFLLTASKRIENSVRPGYDFDTKMLTTDQIKEDYFGGIQCNLNEHIMIGVLYNYYLQRELDANLTLFF